MKKYVLVTCKGDYFEEVLKATTKSDAIKDAIATWNALSAHDKKAYSTAYVIHAPIDKNNELDCYSDATELIYTIK